VRLSSASCLILASRLRLPQPSPQVTLSCKTTE
jgi:hypothetical protein